MRRGFVDTPTGQVHYWEHGDGPALILLHLTPDPRCFLPTMPFLTGRRAIAIDLPGYGDSARPGDPFETIDQYAMAVLHAIDGLGIDRFDLLGHMTGSNMAAEVAALAPDRVRRLVLSELVDWASRPELVGVHARRFPAPEPVADGSHLLEIWGQYAGMLGEVSLEDLQRRFYGLFQAIYAGPLTGGERYGQAGWAAAAPYTIERQPVAERLAKITAPTLVLCAGAGVLRSGADPRADRDRLAAIVPNGTARTIDHLSHVAPFTHPEAFARSVLGFFGE